MEKWELGWWTTEIFNRSTAHVAQTSPILLHSLSHTYSPATVHGSCPNQHSHSQGGYPVPLCALIAEMSGTVCLCATVGGC
jgi:hypothetical protein